MKPRLTRFIRALVLGGLPLLLDACASKCGVFTKGYPLCGL